MMRFVLAALFAAVSFGEIAWAQTEPLLPRAVARSAAEQYPEIQAAVARRREALGRRLSADGAFDTRVRSDVTSRLGGFYSGDIASLDVTKPLAPFGAEVYGGYRIAQGDFPIYDDYNFTNEGGEAKVGILFSLLRGRAIDNRRAGVAEAQIGVNAAELDVLLKQIEVQQSALIAYWRWVAAGRELEAFEELLQLAERRDKALRQEVASGARAAIFITENAQNLTRRRELVRRAEQTLALAANTLSLYYRDGDGDPIVPVRANLPDNAPLPNSARTITPEALLAGRPDLKLFDLAEQRLEVRRSLARNDLQPDLSFKVEASQDFGGIGPGGVSRDPGEIIAGVTLSVPLGRRDARGRLRQAEAALDAVSAERKLLRDRIIQELNDLIIQLRTAKDVLALTKIETEQALIMQEAERERFRGGASDFFLVNIREQTAANAKVRLAQAELTLAAAHISYQAATLDLDSLTRP